MVLFSLGLLMLLCSVFFVNPVFEQYEPAGMVCTDPILASDAYEAGRNNIL